MVNLFKELSPGSKPPQKINVVVDIPTGSSNKYEYQEEKGYFSLDRVLYSPMFFPFDYGFIPQTTAGDGDPLDVVLLTSFPTFPGCVIKSRPIGILFMKDEKGTDHKIIAVPQKKVDPRTKPLQKIEDLPSHLKEEIETFFKDYKKLEKGKFVEIENWGGVSEAQKVISQAVQNWKKKK